MKSTGIVRKIDELGRIVLPIELRRTMKMQIRDEVEITAEDDRIILNISRRRMQAVSSALHRKGCGHLRNIGSAKIAWQSF